MKNKVNKTLKNLVDNIVGKNLWGITQIPRSGIAMSFGKPQKKNPERGEITLWIHSRSRICIGDKVYLEAAFLRTPEEFLEYKKHLENKKVLSTKLYLTDNIKDRNQKPIQENALHLLISPNITLSVFPNIKEKRRYWMICDFRKSIVGEGYTVYSDGIK